MPYPTDASLPQAVKDNYDKRCRDVFRRVWNADYAKNKNESRAFKIANTAASNCKKST